MKTKRIQVLTLPLHNYGPYQGHNNMVTVVTPITIHLVNTAWHLWCHPGVGCPPTAYTGVKAGHTQHTSRLAWHGHCILYLTLWDYWHTTICFPIVDNMADPLVQFKWLKHWTSLSSSPHRQRYCKVSRKWISLTSNIFLLSPRVHASSTPYGVIIGNEVP
jgi:hypothetical protein